MNWNMVGAIGQALGALIVVVTARFLKFHKIIAV